MLQMCISKVVLSFEALVWGTWLTVGKIIPLVVKLSQKKHKRPELARIIKQGVRICVLIANLTISWKLTSQTIGRSQVRWIFEATCIINRSWVYSARIRMLLSEGNDLTIATSDLQLKRHSFLTSPKHSACEAFSDKYDTSIVTVKRKTELFACQL